MENEKGVLEETLSESKIINPSIEKRFRYGWGNIRPRWLQFINHPWCFLIVIMLHSIAQGTAVVGIFNIVAPQIEKRFSLTSTQVGLIAGANDASALIIGLFVSYYGDFANKIKWISFGGIVAGISLILFTLPHFIAGRYKPPSIANLGFSVCQWNESTNVIKPECPEGAAVAWYYMAIFCITQLFVGAGNLPLYTLTPSYISDNLSLRMTPIYIGFWYLSTALGPLFGLGLSGPLMNIYVDITQPKGMKLTPKDPRWIGNWWVGFLGSGFVMTLCSLVLLGFPEYFTLNSNSTRKISEKSTGSNPVVKKSIRVNLDDFRASAKDLFTNTTLMANIIASLLPFLVGTGISTFIAKILILKYGVSIADIGKYLTIMSVPGITVGSILGGFIASKLNPEKSCKRCAFLCLIFSILSITMPLAFNIPGCDNPNVAGLAVPYGKTIFNGKANEFEPFNKSAGFLKSSCNDKCGCSLQGFLPVCGKDNISYLDPCHAGCSTIGSLQPLTFTNCSCVSSSKSSGGSAKILFCDSNCKNWKYFLLLLGFASFTLFLMYVPNRIVVLRCVKQNQQAFAIGIQFVSLKVLANVPGPVILGYFIDRSCDVWQDLCGQRGSCFVYDVKKMSSTITQAFSTSCAFSSVFYFISWWFCKNELQYEVESPDQEKPTVAEYGHQRETTL